MNCWQLKMADQAQYADKPGRTYVFDNTHSVRLAAGDTFAYLDKRGGCYAFTGHGVVVQLRQRAPRKSELLSPKITRVYLKAYANAGEARREPGAYFRFYNEQRPHQALGYRTPAEVFHGDQAVRGEELKERRCLPKPVLSSYAGAVGPSLNSALILSN